MSFTQQQQDIIDHITTNEGLVKVNAIAGSGKTTLLTGIAEALNPTNGLYLAYNKSISTEASKKFPKSIHACTTHSLAYQATVKKYGLLLGFFSYKTITERIKYEHKLLIIEHIKSFCLSKYLSFDDYAKHMLVPEATITLANKYLGLMEQGKIDCTHDFYLKLFHLYLHDGTITYPDFDLIMLDESGDLNPVTLEIFKLLPSTRKVMVGDQHQNIYVFNDTINCFKEMQNEGTLFPMTQSFRVAQPIAEQIEKFCRKYIDPTMEFKGIPLSDTTISSSAYIARTNSSLVAKMMELNEMNTPYSLSRPAKQIFRVPLLLSGLKPNGFISDPEYSHLQDDVNNFYSDRYLMAEFKSAFSYLKSLYSDDIGLLSAMNILSVHGPKKVIECFEEAKKHEKSSHDLLLCSAHSAKGLEFDAVELADDMSQSITDLIVDIRCGKRTISSLTDDELSELNLYYVACSRARKQLTNAKLLEK